jgi:hypothetical protein
MLCKIWQTWNYLFTPFISGLFHYTVKIKCLNVLKKKETKHLFLNSKILVFSIYQQASQGPLCNHTEYNL